MNKAILVGRLTKDPEVRYSAGDNSMAIARFSVAIDRKSNDAGTDFISCVAFGKTAEFIEKYFKKGNKIGIDGHIQTGSYTNKDGAKAYTTDVIVDSCEFVESKSAGQEATTVTYNGGFTTIDDIPEELPFK